MNKIDSIELLNRFYNITRIPCRVYEKSGMEFYCTQTEQLKKTGREYVQEILERLENEVVVLLHLDESVKIPLIMAGMKDAAYYYVLGPVSYAPLSKLQIGKYHALIGETDPAYCRREAVFSEFSILLELLTDIRKDIYFFETLLQNDETQDIEKQLVEEGIKQVDTFQFNHTIDEEMLLLDFIKEGDCTGIRDYLQRYHLAGPIVCRDVKKNQEYMTVITVSLMARAAISGGATSKECFLLNDVYLKRISESSSIAELKKIVHDAAKEFSEIVKRKKQWSNQSPIVNACKKYVIAHRMEKINLSDIAEYLEVSPPYLCRIFKEQEGITVVSYIQKEKITMACNILKYSDRRINEIAEYLKFESVSYFSRCFKKIMGTSPNQYRKKNRVIDF